MLKQLIMSKHTVTFSTELMASFKQVSAIAPQKKFHALQSPEQLPLLFSISNENTLLVTRQLSAQQSGWAQDDVSAALAQYHNGAAVTAKTFAVSQSADKTLFNLAVAVTVNQQDYLYLSLNNTVPASASPTFSVTWQAIPFDDPNYKNIRVIIENLHITQTGGEDFIVADVSRKTFPHPSHYLERYHIDSSNKRESNQYWHAMTLGGDVDPNITSVLGRKDNDEWVDGIYTLGNIGGKSQLIYTPLYNPVNPLAPPHVTRLFIPQQATTIATAATADGLTDLFVAADKCIYYFAAGHQEDKTEGAKILTNHLFEDISHLYAFVNDDKYVLWGLNRANQIFYTSCKKENLNKPAQWTNPVPILANVHQVAPYVNTTDTSSTFFAAAGDRFTVATQSARTGLWDFNEVALKAPPTAKATKVSSYTTLIQLKDEDQFPVPNTAVYLSTSSRTGVYINQLYYVLSPNPLPILTNASGSITLIQELDDLTGAQLYVATEAGDSVTINPMTEPFKKLASLDSADKVKEATIRNENGTSQKLVSGDVSNEELERVAATNKNLGTAYAETWSRTLLMAGGPSRGLAVMAMPLTGNRVFVPGVGWSLFSAIGDLFSYMASGISDLAHATINFVKDTASQLWQLVLKIGDAVYHGILDNVEAVVAAVRWVYDKIKTAIEDLIKFLEFLFQWKDIERTKKVVCHLARISLRHQFNQVPALKQQMHRQFDEVIKVIEKWADIADGAETVSLKKAAKPTEGQSAPGQLLTYHFQGNAAGSQSPALLQAKGFNEDLLKKLMGILEKQKDVFFDVIKKFGALIAELPGLSIADVLKKIAGILASSFIRGVQLFFDVLFDIAEMIGTMLDELLRTPLHIPVVSDILEFFGVGSVSILDILGWVVAIPVTLGYKVCFSKAPFDRELADILLNIKEYSTLEKSLLTAGAPWPSVVPEEKKSALYQACHYGSGVTIALSGVMGVLEAMNGGYWGDANTVLGIISGGFLVIAALEAPRYPIGNISVDIFNTVINVFTVANKLAFFSLGQRAGGLPVMYKGQKEQMDGALALYGIVAGGYHYYEIFHDHPENTNRKQAILEETANVSSNLARVAFAGHSLGFSYTVPFIGIFGIASGGLHISTAVVETKR